MVYYFRNIQDIWGKLLYILTKQQKKYSIALIILTFISAVFETLGVSIIIPLVSAMLSPAQLLQNIYIEQCMDIFGMKTSNQMIFLLSMGVVCIYIVKNIFLTGVSYFRTKYASKVQRELSVKMMSSYLKREYSYFLNINTSNLLRGIKTDVEGVYQVIYQGFRLTAEGITVLCICIFVLRTDFFLALSVMAVIAVCLGVVFFLFRAQMRKFGHMYRESSAGVSKHSYQAFQGIKEIIVMHRQNYFINKYENVYIDMQKANVRQVVAVESPAYIIEGICVTGLILMVCIRITGVTDATVLIPQLAAFAMAAFRILPSLGRISSAFNQLIYYCPSVNATYNNLYEVNQFRQDKHYGERELQRQNNNVRYTFTDKIELKNVCWHYQNANEDILHELNLTIRKGESIAFIGTSGAGKTTLADVILGLLHPQKGIVAMDGININDIKEEWCKIVGYVPQAVFLTDDTIRNNIAFGIDEAVIDDKLVWAALEQSQMSDYVHGLPNGLDTIVGERGVRFSGGQRQRIAISRALYFNPDILVLDEATAALDTETETAVMDSIEALQGHKTLIIVAHRLTTVKKCDVIYEIKNGKAIKRGKEDIF